MNEIEALIARSAHILEWLDDWDGDGAKAINKQAWERAIRWVRANLCGGDPLPDIGPGPDGSIDLWWKDNGRFAFLMNIEAEGLASFYGDKPDGQTVKGDLSLEADALWITEWMVRGAAPRYKRGAYDNVHEYCRPERP